MADGLENLGLMAIAVEGVEAEMRVSLQDEFPIPADRIEDMVTGLRWVRQELTTAAIKERQDQRRDTLLEGYWLADGFGLEPEELDPLKQEITDALISQDQRLQEAVIRKVQAALLGEDGDRERPLHGRGA